MNCVLDSSLALAWLLPDETSEQADKVLATVTTQKGLFWVPALWWYEISNAITVAERRQRLAQASVARGLDLYGALPIQCDDHLDAGMIWSLYKLAQEFGLSAYDAAYLELAERTGLELASLDRRLTGAARKAGIRIVRL